MRKGIDGVDGIASDHEQAPRKTRSTATVLHRLAVGAVASAVVNPYVIHTTVGVSPEFIGYRAPFIPIKISGADINNLPRSTDGVCATPRINPADCIILPIPKQPELLSSGQGNYDGVIANGTYSFRDTLPATYQEALAESLQDPIVNYVSHKYPTLVFVRDSKEDYRLAGSDSDYPDKIVVEIPSDIEGDRIVNTYGGLKATMVHESSHAIFRYVTDNLLASDTVQNFTELCDSMITERLARALKEDSEIVPELENSLRWIWTVPPEDIDENDRMIIVNNLENMISMLKEGQESAFATQMINARSCGIDMLGFENMITDGIDHELKVSFTSYMDTFWGIEDTFAAGSYAHITEETVLVGMVGKGSGWPWGNKSELFASYVDAIQSNPDYLVGKINAMPATERLREKQLVIYVSEILDAAKPDLLDATNAAYVLQGIQ